MSGKRKSETTISEALEEKKPKDSGATSSNTTTLQAPLPPTAQCHKIGPPTPVAQGQPTKVTAHLIQTPQGPRIVLQGIQGADLSKDQLQSIQQQVKDQLLKAQAEAKSQGKIPPTKIAIQLPPAGQPSDQQGGHLSGFAKLAALNGKQVLVSAAHAESDTKGENLKSDIENFESMMHNSNSENEDWEGFIQESYGENFSQNQPQSEEVSAIKPAKKKIENDLFLKSIDDDSNFDLLDVVKNLQHCNIYQLLAFHKLIVDKESDKTDAKYICEECQKEGCRLYCTWRWPSVIQNSLQTLLNQQQEHQQQEQEQPPVPQSSTPTLPVTALSAMESSSAAFLSSTNEIDSLTSAITPLPPQQNATPIPVTAPPSAVTPGTASEGGQGQQSPIIGGEKTNKIQTLKITNDEAKTKFCVECGEKNNEIQTLEISNFRLNIELASTQNALEEAKVECVEKTSKIQTLEIKKIKLETEVTSAHKTLEVLRLFC